MNRLLFALLLVPILALAEYTANDYKYAQKNLDTTYKQVLSKHPNSKALIVKAQQQWIETINADCLALASLPFEGKLTSGYQAEFTACTETELINRTHYLKTNYLD